MRLHHALGVFTLASLTVGFFSPPEEALRGLWRKETKDPRELRFYYFHEGDVGLYRYGRPDLNNTNSFDYRVSGGALHLHFRRTGETHAVAYRIAREGDRTILVLDGDPREPAPTRYVLEAGRFDAEHPAPTHPFARMWIDERTLPGGQRTFRMYQFRIPDGAEAGRGWYHQGDYDDWSTEALAYRKGGGVLRLFFVERREWEETPITEHRDAAPAKAAIELMSDPRNFWHRGRFVDGGRSFQVLEGGPLFEPSR
jgi:hypothetical protein